MKNEQEGLRRAPAPSGDVPVRWNGSGRRICVQGATLACDAFGRGPTMLVLHGGLGIDCSYLRTALAPLATDFRVVCYDQRGHGRSTGRESLASADRGILIEDADAVRDGYGADRVLLFGHSYGGFVALEYALQHPDRVAGLVLCATSASVAHVPTALAAAATFARRDELQALHAVLTNPPSSDEEFGEIWRTITPLYFKDHDPVRARTFDDTRYSALGYAAGARWLADYDVRSRLTHIDVPVLLLHGACDWLMPADVVGIQLAAGLRHATRIVFHESGHYPFVEERRAFLKVIRSWLRPSETSAE